MAISARIRPSDAGLIGGRYILLIAGLGAAALLYGQHNFIGNLLHNTSIQLPPSLEGSPLLTDSKSLSDAQQTVAADLQGGASKTVVGTYAKTANSSKADFWLFVDKGNFATEDKSGEVGWLNQHSGDFNSGFVLSQSSIQSQKINGTWFSCGQMTNSGVIPAISIAMCRWSDYDIRGVLVDNTTSDVNKALAHAGDASQLSEIKGQWL
jgi:hypothetical protein